MSLKKLCWIPYKDNPNLWKKGVIVQQQESSSQNESTMVTVEDEFGRTATFCSQDILYRNEDTDECEDLIQLVHLNDPSILYTLEQRYADDNIYTFNHNILLAVNPYKQLPLYGHMATFRGDQSSLPPHPYTIGERAVASLRSGEGNQSILVSGESGAGKTQTTKYLMHYISEITQARSSSEQMKRMILASNPILEVFGNAKTTQNSNSSRFGKFIKLQFNADHDLVGAKIETYLLEKIRVTSQSRGEQNFHVFNMILKRDNDRGSHQYASLPQVDYEHESMACIIKAMTTLHFNPQEIHWVFNIVQFILLLGDLVCLADVDCQNTFFLKVCKMLDLPPELLSDYLRHKYITVNSDTIKIERCESEFATVRDSTAQTLYEHLFHFIVRKINSVIACQQPAFIGILDIFGFEIFKHNKFEQLCINYTNEKLQHLFNDYIFKLEQREYLQEKIVWEHIQYPDNSVILTMMDARQHSLFALLNEQSILKHGNNKSFYASVCKELESHPHWCVKSAHVPKLQFQIHHYAGTVCYTIKNFVQKNRYQLDPRFLQVFQQNVFIRAHFDAFVSTVGHQTVRASGQTTGQTQKRHTRGSKKSQKKSAGKAKTILHTFKQQLQQLATIVGRTQQHYIRCIKPNDSETPHYFEKKRVYQQLKYCGILEAITIARAGYPIRLSFEQFQNSFFSLARHWKVTVGEMVERIRAPSQQETNGPRLAPVSLRHHLDIQKGSSKYFLKKYVYDRLHCACTILRQEHAVKIQTHFRAHWYHRVYVALQRAVTRMQLQYKHWFGKKTQAARRIVPLLRGFAQRQRYRAVRRAIVCVQLFWYYYRRRMTTKRLRAAVTVQRMYRRQVASRRRVAAGRIQRQYARHVSRRQLLRGLHHFISTKQQIKRLKSQLEDQRRREENMLASFQRDRTQKEAIHTQMERQTKHIELLKEENKAQREREEQLKQQLTQQQQQLRELVQQKKQDLLAERTKQSSLTQMLHQKHKQEQQNTLQELRAAQQQQENYRKAQYEKDAVVSAKMQQMFLDLEKAHQELEMYREQERKHKCKMM